jgi:FkbM family methyltransferase
MFIDSKDTLGLGTNGIYEPRETELVKREIKKGDVVLDIGAHIGYYSLIFAKYVGRKGKVFAFEPDPDNFTLLKKNVEINGYENTVLIQRAVSNQTCKGKLFLWEEGTDDHRIYDSHDNRMCIEIDVIKLDDYFKNYDGKIDFIKIDIQGAELMALKGMSNLLNRNEELRILTEFWPFGLKKSGADSEEYLKLFISHGFELYQINKMRKKMEPLNLSELLETYTPEERNFTSLYCVKRK